ncbi:type II toxin-antitoxin system RelB/DinJ family antitoxin [Lacticaseibacillus parakribbianus]|uniref:type II toxin-antitoxin system RelB/DinJ family antitoxin n=1 Tax=Lacticaseibacillus parakribbianus TaxID=2970927 RepID=UPI0021CB434C|nr:type II toxin-antitoxin system RelB/DinJ family antitoxin [Lacticaseibacillus parakribbianus]
MISDDRIQVRIDHKTKMLAESRLKAQGLTLSEYTRMMVTNVAYSGVKVHFETPNTKLNGSIQEAADFLDGKATLQGYSSADALEKGLMDD